MLKIQDKSKDRSGRINVFLIAAGMMMLAVSLVVQYWRLVG
jgi:hypothetical protein